jgi:phosphoribosylformylglycinamidine (FGAM) synthase-like amidotransferase family enzyme
LRRSEVEPLEHRVVEAVVERSCAVFTQAVQLEREHTVPLAAGGGRSDATSTAATSSLLIVLNDAVSPSA